MSVVNIKLYELVRKEFNLSEIKAKEFIEAIDEIVKEDIKGEGLSELATKSFVREETISTKSFVKDEIHLVKQEIHRLELNTYKAVFWAGLIQFLAIIASLFGIINFMLHK